MAIHDSANAPIDTCILTGYLGAGKTTLLNEMLNLPEVAARRKALIINEFGSLGVDGRIVQRGDYEVIEINRGSIFCICVKTDFIKALTRIRDDLKPELLLIEATGIAEPCDIEAFLEAPGLAGSFAVAGTLCIVDAANFTRVAPYLKSAAHQAAWADAIIINKTDLVSNDELANLHRICSAMNPNAPRTDVQFGRIPWDFLRGIRHHRRGAAAQTSRPSRFHAIALKIREPAARPVFMSCLEALGDALLRLKGTVLFEDGPVFLEKAGGRLMERPPPDNAPDGSAFSLITWDKTADEVKGLFASRFALTED